MSDLKKLLEQMVGAWARLQAPAICERFVLRNGKEFAGRKLPKGFRRGTPKECFSNSADLVARKPALRYVEGFAMREDLGIQFQHAWAIDADDNVIDVTLRDPDKCQYMGVVQSYEECWGEMKRTGVYGLMECGMINVDWMFRIDPDLKAEINKVVGREVA